MIAILGAFLSLISGAAGPIGESDILDLLAVQDTCESRLVPLSQALLAEHRVAMARGYRAFREDRENQTLLARQLEAGDENARFLRSHLGFKLLKNSRGHKTLVPPSEVSELLESIEQVHRVLNPSIKAGLVFRDSDVQDRPITRLSEFSIFPVGAPRVFGPVLYAQDLQTEWTWKTREFVFWLGNGVAPLEFGADMHHALAHLTDFAMYPEGAARIRKFAERVTAGNLEYGDDLSIAGIATLNESQALFLRSIAILEDFAVLKREDPALGLLLEAVPSDISVEQRTSVLQQQSNREILKRAELISQNAFRFLELHGGLYRSFYVQKNLLYGLGRRIAKALAGRPDDRAVFLDPVTDPATAYSYQLATEGLFGTASSVAFLAPIAFGNISDAQLLPELFRALKVSDDDVRMIEWARLWDEALKNSRVSSDHSSVMRHALQQIVFADLARFDVGLRAMYDIDLTWNDVTAESLEQSIARTSKTSRWVERTARPGSLLYFAFAKAAR